MKMETTARLAGSQASSFADLGRAFVCHPKARQAASRKPMADILFETTFQASSKLSSAMASLAQVSRQLFGRVERLGRGEFDALMKDLGGKGLGDANSRWIQYIRAFHLSQSGPDKRDAKKPQAPTTRSKRKRMHRDSTAEARPTHLLVCSRKKARRVKQRRESLCVGSRVDVYWNGDDCWFQAEVLFLDESDPANTKVVVEYGDLDPRNTVLELKNFRAKPDVAKDELVFRMAKSKRGGLKKTSLNTHHSRLEVLEGLLRHLSNGFLAQLSMHVAKSNPNATSASGSIMMEKLTAPALAEAVDMAQAAALLSTAPE